MFDGSGRLANYSVGLENDANPGNLGCSRGCHGRGV